MKLGFLKTTIAVIALGALAGACDDPVSSGRHDAPPVAGLVILADGQEVITVDAQRSVEGELVVEAGSELEVEVRFRDADGDPLSPDPAEFSAHLEIDDASVADFHRVSAFVGHVEGVSVGETTGVVELVHGTDDEDDHDHEDDHENGGHADYTSPPIPVRVSAN